MEAVCRAAAELFARRGTAAVSSRDIAAHAGVNYGLLHRYFGSRAQLQRAVMTRLAEDLTEALEEGRQKDRSPLETLAEHPTYWRALARAVLDGEDLASLQHEHPVMRQFLSLIEEDSRPDGATPSARLTLLFVAAGLLGLSVFGPFLRESLDLTGLDDAKLNERFQRALAGLVRQTGESGS